MTGATTDIIENIKAGIEKDGEYKLLLIDQMKFAEEGVDMQDVFRKESWLPEHGHFDSILIRNCPDNFKYEDTSIPEKAKI